jgi:hypothetical protein
VRSPRLAPAFRLLAPLALVGCTVFSDPVDPDTTAMPKSVGMIVIESDFQTGAAFAVDPDTHAGSGHDPDILWDPDPQLRRLIDPSGVEHLFVLGRRLGRIMEINRKAEPVTVYDAAAHKDVIRYWSVVDDGADPSSADPYDAAYAPDGSLWVTRYFQSSLVILDASGKRTGTVDLKAWADADGNPEMTAIAIIGNTAYVALARLGYASKEDTMPGPTAMGSIIVAIDTTTHAVTQAFPSGALPVPTPVERFRHAVYGPATQLFLACRGAPLSLNKVPGGLVRLDFAAKTQTLVLDGRELTPVGGTTFRGFVSGYDVLDDERGFAVIASMESSDNPTSVVEFNPTTGKIVSPVWYGRSTYKLFDLAIADDRLLVADRTDDALAVVVLDASDGTTIGRVTTALPPVEMVLLRPQK